MSNFEVPDPILNSPYEEPAEHWDLREGEMPVKKENRRPAGYFYRDPKAPMGEDNHGARGYWVPLETVNLIRERLKEWRGQGRPNMTRTTWELIHYWRREGRKERLFFAQLEAVETIIFLVEARSDLLQGIDTPLDEPSEDRKAQGFSAFRRYACKMATGTGKTTVMAMLAAWSILNKINDPGDARYSNVVLIVCPNVTIRNRLNELDPCLGEASLYRTRDLVSPHLMPDLSKGKVLVTNWHLFEPQSVQTGGVPARVVKAGVPVKTTETITIGKENTTARGTRYLTLETLERQIAGGMIRVLSNGEERDKQGNLKKVKVESVRYIESDGRWIERVLGKQVGKKQNILVFNDEAHHAYRIRKPEPEETERDLFGEEEESEEFFKEATVWVEGLDKIHKIRGMNFCLDFSATPYFLGRVGQEANRIFPWVVSDFGLTDAIESGLVKIPQMAVRDTTGREIPGFFNIWHWIIPKLTPAERGGKKGNPKPEAILKWAHAPIAMLGGLWEEVKREWKEHREDPRHPVFILVCKNTRLAKIIYEWLAEDNPPMGIPSAGIAGFRNRDGRVATIRVDSKVVHETDTGEAKGDESRWMRLTLDTVGKISWPKDRQGNSLFPEGFEELAKKLERPLNPPGRDVHCIVSVGMLTEGWDCTTVTHIVGLRPFMSQLLCEQVVGRGLRRTNYDVGEEDKLTEEVAKIFGVPFEVIPFKSTGGTPPPPVKKHHIQAVPQKAEFEIIYPRVEGYSQAIRNKVQVNWNTVPKLILDPLNIPPEVEMKATIPNNIGRPSLSGPGRLERVDLNPYRSGKRFQELVFELARDLTREYTAHASCEVPAHVLFPQLAKIIEKYLREKVRPIEPAKILDVFLSPYYGWVIERLVEAVHPDTSQGEASEVPRYETNRGPGSTSEVDYWTSKEVREVVHCHLNYLVADTKQWEQSAAYTIDTHPQVEAFVKNAGLGFAIPYLHNGRMHDYIPDFIIRLKSVAGFHLILETKGFDPLAEIKAQAAHRWVSAVNAEGKYGKWFYAVAGKPEEVKKRINEAIDIAGDGHTWR